MTAAVWVGAKVRRERRHPLFVFKNKALVYLCFECLLPLRYGTSTCTLVGRPSTRGRIYVAFGEHTAAGGWYVFFLHLGVLPNA